MNTIRTGRSRSAAAMTRAGGDGPARHRSRWRGRSRVAHRRDAHDRPCRRPRCARSDARADLCRAHGLPAHVREALRPERTASDRSAAGSRDAVPLGRQEDDDDQDPPRCPLQRRSPAECRGGQDLARPAQDAVRIGPGERDLADHRRPGREQLHGSAAAQRALLAADGPAGGPRGDDHVAAGARAARDEVRIGPRVRRAVQVHEPHGGRPDRARQVAVLLRAEPGQAEPDRLPDHHRHERARREPALARHQRARPHRVDRPAGDPARPEPARLEGDVDRLSGDLDQHREQERDREAVRERRHAARLP